MERLIKMVKGTVMVLGLLAILASVGTLSVEAQYHEDPNPGGGSGGSLWHVTCQYDGNNVLLSKTCTSGGSFSCAC